MGQKDQALSEVDNVLNGLTALGMIPESITLLHVLRVRAEILVRSGKFKQALVDLETLAQRLRELGIADVELGQVLDLRGCALRALGRWRDAFAAHETARAHLQKQLLDDHPFLLRNLLYKEAAAGNLEGFRFYAERLKVKMMPDSIWRNFLDAAVVSFECRSGAATPCVIVL